MSLTSPEAIAREYGGNKKKIAEAARMGLLDPTAAVMAGMFIDKMRAAAAAEQTPDTTVAQDVLGAPPAPMPTAMQAPQQGQGIPAAQLAAAPQGRPMPQMPQPMPQQAQGLEALPAGNVGNFAGGGIVAFAGGGITDEEARRLGYSDAEEYEAFMRIRGARAGETTPMPVDSNMEIIRQSPRLEQQDTRQYYATPYQEEVFRRYRENPDAGDIIADLNRGLAPEADNREIVEQFEREAPEPGVRKPAAPELRPPPQNGVDFTTPFSMLPRPGETNRATAERMDTRQAVENTIGLPGILKSRPDLSTGFPSSAAPTVTTPEAAPVATRGAPYAEALPPITPPKMGQGMPSDEEIAERTARAVERIYPSKDMPKELTGKDAMDSIKKAYADAGYDSELFKKQQEEVAKERSELKAKRAEATNLRIIEAGLLIMGGKSPYGLQNISEATPAVKGLAQDIKDFDKADKEYRAAERMMAAEQNKVAAGMAGASLDLVEKSKDRMERASEKRGAASATIFSTIVGAEKQLEGISRQIEGQLTATGMNNESAANVARIYTGGYMALEQMRQRGMPDAYKLANSPDMIRSMPNSTFKERLEAVSQATHPKDIKNALLNATNQVQKRANEEWANKLLFDKDIKELKKKADAGDAAAKKELEKRKNGTFDAMMEEYFSGYERLRQGAGGGEGDKLPGQTPAPSAGGFIVNTPQGPISFQTKEQADAFRKQYNLP